ncbi:conserved hypothetical protein [Methylorubrum extorquens AM1]|uniref:Uncharacterized protein n=1 Tax=Methylorubrum extorquens (strain ATCC 14718 / DSM 1338 / JCM 2805 / NCIMB 9133 / AM1) TaxID=272630 RepID=C5AQV6_METEA|nr:conserved hypothetical protein [Methylorubrum extorquens AM1]
MGRVPRQPILDARVAPPRSVLGGRTSWRDIEPTEVALERPPPESPGYDRRRAHPHHAAASGSFPHGRRIGALIPSGGR